MNILKIIIEWLKSFIPAKEEVSENIDFEVVVDDDGISFLGSVLIKNERVTITTTKLTWDELMNIRK